MAKVRLLPPKKVRQTIELINRYFQNKPVDLDKIKRVILSDGTILTPISYNNKKKKKG